MNERTAVHPARTSNTAISVQPHSMQRTSEQQLHAKRRKRENVQNGRQAEGATTDLRYDWFLRGLMLAFASLRLRAFPDAAFTSGFDVVESAAASAWGYPTERDRKRGNVLGVFVLHTLKSLLPFRTGGRVRLQVCSKWNASKSSVKKSRFFNEPKIVRP